MYTRNMKVESFHSVFRKRKQNQADSIMGTWKTIGNPCTGPDADKTFYAQSTYVQPVIGKKDAYIAMFDRWKKKDLEDSRYVWLPVLVKDGKITIPWHEKWTLSIFDK